MQPPFVLRGHEFQPQSLASRPAPACPVLLFDLCGVLFDDTIWTRWLFQLVSRVGPRLCYSQFANEWEERFAGDVNGGRRDYWEAVQQYLVSLKVPRAAADEICVAAKARRRQFDESIRPLPGTRAGLSTLASAGYRLAVIGNLPADTGAVCQRVARLGLSEFFDKVFSSFDLGRESSGLTCYRCIADRLSIRPELLWLVSGSALQLAAASADQLSVIAWQNSQPRNGVPGIDHLHELLTFLGRPQTLAG